MAFSQRSRLPSVVFLVVFIIAALASSVLVWTLEQQRYQEERARTADVAHYHAQALQRMLERNLSANYAMAALVRQGNGAAGDFEAIAREILSFYPDIATLGLAPDGMVTHVAPVSGNERALGFDIFQDPVQRAEALRARSSGQLTLTGPLTLVQGGQGVVGRLPVYLNDEAGRPRFWGFTNTAIRMPDLLAAARLTRLEERGFAYVLWRAVPGTSERQTIAASRTAVLHAPVERSVELPNATWTLEISPVRGWELPQHLIAQGIPALLCSLLVAYLAKMAVDLKLHQRRLAELAHVRAEEVLATERHLKATLEALPDPLFEMGLDGTIYEYHAPRNDFFGNSAGPLTGKKVSDLLPREIAQPVLRALEDAHATTWSAGTEIRLRLPQGKFWFELSIVRKQVDHGVEPRFVLLARDITERRRAERRVRRLAHFDSLTGLPNRALLRDRVELAIAAARRGNTTIALAFLDLDHFKKINDSLGHRVGDELLAVLARRLRHTVREQDTFSRLGGDEFVLVMPGTDAEGAAQVAAKLIAASALPYHIDDHELTITMSIGIVMYPADGENFDTLYQHADAATYRAKADGRNRYCFFTSEIQDRSARTLQLENALRRALERNQLSLHYQPQVELASGRVMGAEALLRWQHPDLGNVSPAEFIPLAEDTGLIVPIGEWVLRTAAGQLKAWQSAGMAPPALSVNLSAVQFRQPNLCEMVTRILGDAGLRPGDLELELTEGTAIANPRAAIETMRRLQQLGVHLAMDDFGTGYSSLNHLKRFRIHRLKIDQSFVRDLTQDRDGDAIVSAIIQMAHAMGIRTTAEGVETEQQAQCLRAQGCQEAQGYLFSRPLPPQAFEAFMATQLRG
jgi:diguanylate cyclase (GGDEF)-like protein/PAS domain S-box-containing protein